MIADIASGNVDTADVVFVGLTFAVLAAACCASRRAEMTF